MSLGGVVIPSFGYASIFYIMGIGTLVWALAFWLLAFDSPSEHPRISEKELALFPEHVNDDGSKKKVRD